MACCTAYACNAGCACQARKSAPTRAKLGAASKSFDAAWPRPHRTACRETRCDDAVRWWRSEPPLRGCVLQSTRGREWGEKTGATLDLEPRQVLTRSGSRNKSALREAHLRNCRLGVKTTEGHPSSVRAGAHALRLKWHTHAYRRFDRPRRHAEYRTRFRYAIPTCLPPFCRV